VKDRPVVVVVAQLVVRDRIQLIVAPLTHSPPKNPRDAVEVPSNVKKQLGLDNERSWVVTNEINSFIWPGPDVRPVKGGDGTPLLGAVPPQLLEMIKASILDHAASHRLKTTKRTQ
jgi:PemK-like, MazF-like toxin of type II toxin-antitoxin system